jgi:hypothetical protein
MLRGKSEERRHPCRRKRSGGCMVEKIKILNKSLYYCKCFNFGDELNKYLFEKVFCVRFNYCTDIWYADYTAIGSVLGWSCQKKDGIKNSIKQKLYLIYNLLRGNKIKLSKLTVLGSGFMNWSDEYKIKYLRKMDFQIVRGKLTENYIRKNNLLKSNILLGDLGLLCPYMVKEIVKKYKLGIIPHYDDLNSSAIYDIYKKYGKKCIIINVQNNVDMVITQITECENIISSSLHGLIVADSFNIPNLWFENPLKYIPMESKDLGRFKYMDYYSIYGIEDIEPRNILDFIDDSLDIIEKEYRVKKEIVEEKQKELYEYCKTYFENIETK